MQSRDGCGDDADHGDTLAAYELRRDGGDGDVYWRGSGFERANAKVR